MAIPPETIANTAPGLGHALRCGIRQPFGRLYVALSDAKLVPDSPGGELQKPAFEGTAVGLVMEVRHKESEIRK